MNKLHNSNGEWLTVKQVSYMTGKSIDAIRMLLHRKKLGNVKKVNNHNGGPNRALWLIHKDEATLLCNSHITDEQPDVMNNNNITEAQELSHNTLHNIDVIPLHYHDQKQREWLTERDTLQAGLMMYRYKFEELERQVRLLPAPPEVVTSKLVENDQALRSAQEVIKALEEAMQRERQRSWWDRLWKK